jgi:formate/nitrite transporter FocA (FNT family)
MINIIKKSILAGILIGLGVIINLQSEIPAIGALFFSFGLLTIINMQLNLYTGKIGFFAEFNYSRFTTVIFLITILIFNCIGIAATIGLYTLGNQSFIGIISAAAASKFAKTALTLFINACFCGALINFAVKNKVTILTIFAVMIFILIGAEHCIADFPYLLFNLSPINVLKFAFIVLGNSIGAILIERLSK